MPDAERPGRLQPAVAACRRWASPCLRAWTFRCVARALAPVLLLGLLLAPGCAKYNTYYNAKRAFDNAERVRDDAIRRNQDPPKPVGAQKTDYETAIAKAQKVLDEYPGHELSDDALFLRAKAYHRLESYRMSIRQFDLLFANFPTTKYLEESLYLQALNYLLIDAVDRSQDFLGQLERAYPDSRYQAEVSRVSGDNAYTLEQWGAAQSAYRQYLALGDKARDRDRVSLKLAECLWELKRYAAADTVLTSMLAQAAPGELKFRAELLRGRTLARTGAFDQADEILDGLDQAAAFHKAEGELALVKSELLVARGNPGDAAALLQAMPAEWQTPVVKARAADVLGFQHLERQEYAEAYEQFKIALPQKKELDDPERTRQLNDQLRDYLAAEKELADAPRSRIPRLKLLQANALLFGFDRPAQAAALYRAAAADTAADSLLAARALYGLWVAQAQRLDQPDSASATAAELLARFPDSAQAREVRADRGGDLLEFLLAERAADQQRNLANLTPEARAALEEVIVTREDGAAEAGSGGFRARRRLVYLSRRANLAFPPPEIVVPIGGHPGREATPAAPGTSRTGGAVPVAGEGPGAAADGDAGTFIESGLTSTGAATAADTTAAGASGDRTGVPEEPTETKKKRDPNWDRLREPAPAPRP